MAPTPRIHLQGFIDVPQEHLQAVSAALPLHIEKTLLEPGCLSFKVTPDDTIPGRFLVDELFIDRAAFDAHQARTTASPWADITQGVPRSYTINEITA